MDKSFHSVPFQLFREAVLVRGNLQTVLLNDINLTEGYLTTSTQQVFSLNVTLSSAHASHVGVRGLVNSFNLPQEWNRTLLVSCLAIPGYDNGMVEMGKFFKTHFVVNELLGFCVYVRIFLFFKLLQALGGQNMPGSLTLSGTVVVKRDVVVTGRVGRERMVKLSQQVAMLDRKTLISGNITQSNCFHIVFDIYIYSIAILKDSLLNRQFYQMYGICESSWL